MDMQVAIIDDSPTNLKVYASVLARLPGVEAKPFGSSAEGLVWCKANEPALIVLDYHMPNPNGLEFLQDYQRARPTAQTPIVMITSEQDRKLRHNALELGAADFLTKPADPTEFLVRIRNLLTVVQSRQFLEQRSAVLAGASKIALHDAASSGAETITLLMRAVEHPDDPSGMHVIRIGQYAALLARAVGLSIEEQRLLMLAAPIHDIGKAVVPDTLLQKPGKLTHEERLIVRAHPSAGYEMLKNARSPELQLGAEIALSHHEHWDGGGYPNGRAGAAIPISARIVAVADAFDAMLSDRPYRNALPFEQVFAELRNQSGAQFDPAVTKAAELNRAEMLGIASTFAAAAGVP